MSDDPQNDLANFTVGYLMVKAHLAAFAQGRELDETWRLVIHQDDFNELVEKAGTSMDILETESPAPLCILDQDMVEVIEGKPVPLRGQLLVVPPEQVSRLGLEDC